MRSQQLAHHVIIKGPRAYNDPREQRAARSAYRKTVGWEPERTRYDEPANLDETVPRPARLEAGFRPTRQACTTSTAADDVNLLRKTQSRRAVPGAGSAAQALTSPHELGDQGGARAGPPPSESSDDNGLVRPRGECKDGAVSDCAQMHLDSRFSPFR